MAEYIPQFTHAEDCIFDDEHVFLEEEMAVLTQGYMDAYEENMTANPVIIGVGESYAATAVALAGPLGDDPSEMYAEASVYFSCLPLRGALLATPAFASVLGGSPCEDGKYYDPKTMNDQPYVQGFNIIGMYNEEGFPHWGFFYTVGTDDDGIHYWADRVPLFDGLEVGGEDDHLLLAVLRSVLVTDGFPKKTRRRLRKNPMYRAQLAGAIRRNMARSGRFIFDDRLPWWEA